MLSEKIFKEKIEQILKHEIDFEDFMFVSDLIYSDEEKQGNAMITDYYYLYSNYRDNSIIHFKEVTTGKFDYLDDVYDEETVGYEILRCYEFK